MKAENLISSLSCGTQDTSALHATSTHETQLESAFSDKRKKFVSGLKKEGGEKKGSLNPEPPAGLSLEVFCVG